MDNQYYTVSAVVNSLLIDHRESDHMYYLYLHWALEGLREMHFDFAQEVKTVKLVVNSYRAVDLPSGFVDYVKVGIQSGERVVVLGVATELSRIRPVDDCGTTLPNAAQAPSTPPNGTSLAAIGMSFCNYNGGSVEALMNGIPSKGYFKVLKEYGQIQFDADIPVGSEIYLEYITDGFDPSEASLVHPYAFNYLKAYVDYKRVDTDDNAGSGLKHEKGQKLFYAEKKAKMRIKLANFNAEDIINSSRAGYRLTTKV